MSSSNWMIRIIHHIFEIRRYRFDILKILIQTLLVCGRIAMEFSMSFLREVATPDPWNSRPD